MRRSSILLALVVAAVPALAGADDLANRAREVFRAIPFLPPTLERNPLTHEKVELGRMLYFDPRLSASGLISCNTCHNLGTGGVDLQQTSVGHGWQRGPRNAPTVLNAVFNIAQFWDGRAGDLAQQAKGPVQASVEMNSTPERTLEVLGSMAEYRARFGRAFPGEAEPLTFDNVAKAVEAFEATLITPDAPFDRYLLGDEEALSAGERKGLDAFVDQGCGGCHGGVNLGGEGYYPFGVLERPADAILPPGDKGRYGVTNTAEDQYVFKAPTLRNIELTPPYFHSGSIWSLPEAVEIMASAQLGIELGEAELARVVEFLLTLTGRQPRVELPLLPPNSASTPRPRL